MSDLVEHHLELIIAQADTDRAEGMAQYHKVQRVYLGVPNPTPGQPHPLRVQAGDRQGQEVDFIPVAVDLKLEQDYVDFYIYDYTVYCDAYDSNPGNGAIDDPDECYRERHEMVNDYASTDAGYYDVWSLELDVVDIDSQVSGSSTPTSRAGPSPPASHPRPKRPSKRSSSSAIPQRSAKRSATRKPTLWRVAA